MYLFIINIFDDLNYQLDSGCQIYSCDCNDCHYSGCYSTCDNSCDCVCYCDNY